MADERSPIEVAIRIIDLAIERGAFKGHEILPIGQARQDLVEMLRQTNPELISDGQDDQY